MKEDLFNFNYKTCLVYIFLYNLVILTVEDEVIYL